MKKRLLASTVVPNTLEPYLFVTQLVRPVFFHLQQWPVIGSIAVDDFAMVQHLIRGNSAVGLLYISHPLTLSKKTVKPKESDSNQC